MHINLRCTCQEDEAFGIAGKLQIEFPGVSTSEVRAMAMQGDRLIVLAKVLGSSKSEAALAAVLSNGTLDARFGERGFVTAPFGVDGRALPIDLVATRDGKLVVLAEDRSRIDSAPLLVRYHPDGTLDHTFGVEGVLSLRLEGARVSDEPFSLLELDDGGLLVVMTRFDENADACGVLVRLRADGTVEQRFADHGWLVYKLVDEPQLWFEGAMQQADGKIVAWGSTASGGLLLRLQQDGEQDPSFGDRGCARIALPSVFHNTGMELFDVSEDGNGALLVVGGTDNAPYAGVLTRLTCSGAADLRFNAGMVRVNSAFPQGSRWLRGFVQADGDIVVAGITGVPFQGEDTRFLMGRYRADGGLDSRFADGTGLLASDIAQGADITTCALAWGDSRLLLGGISGAGNKGQSCVISYRV